MIPAPIGVTADVMEAVLGSGDVSKLTAPQRVEYLTAVCKSLGLNPLTLPLAFQQLGGKTVLYARRECGDQLRRLHGVNIEIVSREKIDELLVVTARATDKTGRQDESIGAISTKDLKGEALANAMMKCETKAKRRVTLSICGLGVMDELEVESVQRAEQEIRPDAATVGYLVADEIDPDMKKAIAAFGEMKEQIGAESYYRILGAEGYEHCNEIRKVADRRRVYGLMKMEQKTQ